MVHASIFRALNVGVRQKHLLLPFQSSYPFFTDDVMRVDRAETLGLKPPKEVKLAIEKNPDRRNHNLFEGEVI